MSEEKLNRRPAILIFANNFPPEHGGIQRYMQRIAQSLSLRGAEAIHVVAPKTAGGPEFDESQPYRVTRTSPQRPLQVIASILAAFQIASKRRIRFTIASIWFPAGLAGALLPRLVRGRLVVLAHGSEIAPTKRGIRRRLMRFVFARADCIAANSSYTQQLLLDAGISRRVFVVPCGVDPAPEPHGEFSIRPTVLSVGRLVARKGFDVVIRAIARLKPEFPTICYIIIGAGPEEARLKTLAREESVVDSIEFLGAITDSDLRRAYATAWCFALPARRIIDDVEGFGIVYLEAAMMGLASVGGRNSGAVDAIVDGTTGLLVDGESVDDVANAIRRLISDRELADRMGRAARHRALQLTWQRCVDALYEIAL